MFQVFQVGADCVEAELAGRAAAEASGATYVSPYNDLQVVAGQGTISLELLAELGPGRLDAVFVPVGGGGLIAGIAAVLKAASPAITIVGCQPAASDIMRQSVAAGAIVDAPSGDTLSDATAGGIEPGAITLVPCMQLVDEWVTVTEAEIGDALLGLLHHQSKLVEGSAACAIAALLKTKEQWAGKSVVVIACGGNIALSTLRKLINSRPDIG